MASPLKKGNVEAENMSQSLTLALISVSAALYAVAIAGTAFIPTPWGIGHFRPGVVIPALFAVIFGPFISGVGAAIGCFVGDLYLTLFGYTTPLLSLVAGVPGNFVGFYLLGWLISKHRSLASFILYSFTALVVGNFIAALGVLGYFWFITLGWMSFPIEFKITITVGLTLFWLLTMVIFVVPLVPILVNYVEPYLRNSGIRGTSKLIWGNPLDITKSAGAVALILVGLYVIVPFIPEGELIFSNAALPPWLLLMAAGVVFAFGLIFALFASKLEKEMTH